MTVRNRVHCCDVRLDEGETIDLPTRPDWDTYFYVFEGAVTANETHFDTAESGLLVDHEGVTITADENSVLVVFVTDPGAEVTRQGTIGR